MTLIAQISISKTIIARLKFEDVLFVTNDHMIQSEVDNDVTNQNWYTVQ